MMLWSDVHYAEQPLTDARLEAYLAALRPLYPNGRVLLRCFQPTDAAAFHSASRHDWRGRDHLLSSFLNAPSIRAFLGELQIPSPLRLPAFHCYSAYEMEGTLTVTLLRGGAYQMFPGTEDKARRLSREFVAAIGHDYTQVFSIEGAWTGWFLDVAWDSSFVVYDPQGMRWWILCLTDTD
ncbi:MAG: hypothetical protein J0M24_17335 [Verrucomicrobia bacterium]|nr:hypothetical protein [Verrucomicrobiota bacterium]